MTLFKRVAAIVALTATVGASVPVAATAHSSWRGSVVSVEPIEHLTSGELTQYLQSTGMKTEPAKYGADAYRVVYRTITPEGRPTTASGLVALPRRTERSLSLVTFLHGTNATRASTASVSRSSPDRVRSLMFAGAGFAVTAPDLLGLGTGPGRHPYGDTASETSASADQLIAARRLSETLGRSVRNDVLVTGFSEGGRITLSLGRALQRGEVQGFGLRAMAPVAGPYDLLGVELPALVNGQVSPFVATLYLGYFITAWSRLIPLYDDPSEVFLPPYDRVVDSMFDGSHTVQEIAAALPGSPDKLVRASFLQQLVQPTGLLGKRLREADRICTDWTPRVPTRFYTGSADLDVPAANAHSCRSGLDPRGTRSTVTDTGPVDHNRTAELAYPQILGWFTTLTR
ncbi:alpha/beta fold hydrolase [Kribbella albertanoniae]|uniref:Alpha/beta fold hydrolase n=1 Tax=Kribbella albertanoniae TaxID=1266829 RepID=A0A4R4PGY2_9ACTN|nr:alpha/beta fold hydrolase [Kribbella albertanoniae]TDC21210.1 alpha/beta fold hydrolase [Kribbella albertanoniae]